MCGVVGVLRFGEHPVVPSYNMSALFLATSLLESSENRGPDATGVSALFDNGNFFIQKMAIGAAEFITRSGGKSEDYEGLMAILRNYSKSHMRCFIGHCRKKSVGELVNSDNHPIKAGNIVGVHNGTLKNDKEIFKNLDCQRDGKVDSEAIFRLLQHYTNDCTLPFTKEALVEVCTRLEGTYSFIAYNANNPYQVVSAKDGRPAEYCFIRPLGLVLIASETKFIDRALWNYNKQARLFPTGNPETAFVALTKDDVEYFTLPNDTVAIFDLTKEVTADTKLADLYETEKVPFQVKPNWKSALTTTYTGNAANTNGNVHKPHHSANKGNYANGYSGGDAGDGKKNTPNTTEKPGTDGQKPGAKEADDSEGKLWDSKLETLVRVFGNRKLIEHGVVVDVDTCRHTRLNESMSCDILDSADADEAKKTPGAGSTTDVVESGAVVADDYSPTDKLTFSKDVGAVENYMPGNKVSIVKIKPIKNDAVEDIKKGIAAVKYSKTTPIKAHDAAVLAAKTIEKFENDDELATFIGIDTDSLTQLPLSALANRIASRLFSKFFVNGWEACNDGYANSGGADIDAKLEKSMKHIRLLKHLSTSLDSVVEMLSAEEIDENTIAPTARLIAAALSSSSNEMTKDALNDIFNGGDYRKSKILRAIVANIE